MIAMNTLRMVWYPQSSHTTFPPLLASTSLLERYNIVYCKFWAVGGYHAARPEASLIIQFPLSRVCHWKGSMYKGGGFSAELCSLFCYRLL